MIGTLELSDVRAGWTSASNAEADSLCPGRHQAQRGLTGKRSKDADSGTRIHDALATGETEGLNLRERETYDACRELEAALITKFFGAGVEPSRSFRHERMWIEWPDDGLNHSGEVDVCHRHGLRALVIDFKSAMGDVAESPRNLQLRDHAVLVRRHFVALDEVGVAIVQPWVTRSPELCVYGTDDLDLAESELYRRVYASNQPDAQRVAGKQCDFCLAKRNCTVYQQHASQVTPPAMLSVMGVPIADWTNEQLSYALEHLGAAQDLLDSIKAEGKERLKANPAALAGWTLAAGRKLETITNPMLVHQRFCALGGNTDDFMKAIRVTKTDLKEAVNATTGAKGQALDNAMKALLDGATETKESEPSLKRVK